MMSPETVLSDASPRRPETSALALTTPRVRATSRGTATLISAFGSAGAEVAEHLEEVVPAQLRVVDLDVVVGDLDAEVLDGDVVHFDADAGLVVGDDVDLAADEADLERAHGLDVDDARLARVDDPLLQGHDCFSCVSRGFDVAIYRVIRE